ncbi:hypothetical protein FH972_021019 [Carpinus fangiana]|nr:hypothetical protein FH972_021019 [Carpinus fangiana]
MNEEAAQLRDSSPDEYGFFASLPSLLQEEDAINEIVYCLDVLKADGVTLFTRYGSDNHYLGHPNFARIWATLNERSAVVFVHPTHAVDTNLVNSHLPQPMIDYPHETTRTAIDLVMSKTVRNNPKCKIILSHAGGTLPYLALRPAMMLPHTPFQVGMTPETFLEDARSFYFDLALSGTRYQLGALLDFAKPGHILFGSDYPYAPSAAIEQMNRGLDDFTWSSEGKELYHAMQANALRLFPRLAKSSLSVPTANKSGKVALTNAYFRSIIVWFAVSSLLCLLSLRMAPLYWSRF